MQMQNLFLLFFLIATSCQAAGLLYARSHQSFSEKQKKLLWNTHLWVNGLLWFITIFWGGIIQFILPRTPYPLIWQLSGVIFLMAGIILVIRSYFVLGFKRVMGIRFFFPEQDKPIKDDVYHFSFIRNPMYDGYLLASFGLGFMLGIKFDFYMTLAIFILLNLFLANVENYKFSLNPF